MNKIMIHTSWGHPQETLELAEGVWRVSTASHGGLKLSRERWEELPDVVRDSFITPTFAEEDCEESIAMTLLKSGQRPGPGAGPTGSAQLPQVCSCAVLPAGHRTWAALPRHLLLGRTLHRPVRAVRHPHRGRVLRGRRRDGRGLRKDGSRRVQPGAPALPHLKNKTKWAKPSLE